METKAKERDLILNSLAYKLIQRLNQGFSVWFYNGIEQPLLLSSELFRQSFSPVGGNAQSFSADRRASAKLAPVHLRNCLLGSYTHFFGLVFEKKIAYYHCFSQRKTKSGLENE